MLLLKAKNLTRKVVNGSVGPGISRVHGSGFLLLHLALEGAILVLFGYLGGQRVNGSQTRTPNLLSWQVSLTLDRI